MHQLMTLPHFLFLFFNIFIFSSSEFILNVNWYYMFARDMYQVYEINDDWLTIFIKSYIVVFLQLIYIV